MTNIDEKYMRRALQLAKLGEGSVSPNPMVGAVIVHNGKIIGEGFHRRYGEAHAEVNAIRSVVPEDEHLLRQSSIYVTLEPCSHYGKTPPCSKLLIEKGIPHVIIGSLDPFKEVQGRGIRMLREAGCNVTTGILEEECKTLNAKFLTAHTLQRPYILLKWAESADRFIDRFRSKEEPPAVFSTPATSVLVHKLRSEYDAIMAGSNTLRFDNPSLTVRYWTGRSPLRVVLNRSNTLPPDSLIFTDGNPTLVFTGNRLPETMPGKVAYETIPDNAPPLFHICKTLYERGISSLMVEGGTQLINAFLEAGLWDEIRVERSPMLLGKGVSAPQIPNGIQTEKRIDKNLLIRIKRR